MNEERARLLVQETRESLDRYTDWQDKERPWVGVELAINVAEQCCDRGEYAKAATICKTLQVCYGLNDDCDFWDGLVARCLEEIYTA